MTRRPVPSCPVCSETSSTPWLSASGFELVRCACGHRYSTEVLEAETLSGTYYNEEEEALAAKGMASKRARFGEYMSLLNGVHNGAAVLDIGCNTGDLLSLFKERGFTVYGVEASPGPAALAAKRLRAPVWQGMVEDVLPAGLEVDVITITHVLEHIAQPIALLEHLRRALRPGGKLLVEVPNAEDILLSAWGGRYRNLCPGDHISFFDQRSLAGALERAGFSVQAMEAPGHARDIVFPSLLSAVDALRPRAAGTGVMQQTRYRGRFRGALRTVVDVAVAVADPVVAPMLDFVALRRGAALISVATA